MSQTARNSLKLSFFTIISRFLGLMRDHYQAVFFGTGPIATAWEIAYMLPNMLRNLLAEGVLSQSFIPVYSGSLKESELEGRRVAGVILSFLVLFLAVLVMIGILVFPYFIPVYIGKSQDDSFLTIELAQIMFFFIMTTSLTAIFAGISNTHNFFTVPALSPILLNLVLISSFVALDFLNFTSERNVRFLAWGVIAGGIIQLGFQALHVYKIGYWPLFKINFKDPALKKIFTLMAPAVLGAGLFQINQMMDIALASYFIADDAGAIPALRYAHRLIQLPTGIIGVALSTTILPALVASLRKGEEHKNPEELVSALSFSFFLTVPAAIGLYLLGPDIINTIFYGGAWDIKSTNATWLALQFYCIGVPLYSTNKILTSTYYAYSDTKTPIKIMIVTVMINLALNLALIHTLRQGALALSTSASAVINGVTLLYFLRYKMKTIPLRKFMISLSRQLPLWLSLAAFLFISEYYLSGMLDAAAEFITEVLNSHLIVRYRSMVRVLLGSIGGIFIYFTFAYYLRIPEANVFFSILERFKKK